MKFTVSKLVSYLKSLLSDDTNIQNAVVSGEISNFHRHHSGHLYFTLKDEKSSINCVMFKSNAFSLSFEPKNGDKVLIKTNISVFEATGQLQAYVVAMKKDGLGDLYLKYEELKRKLTLEGLFSKEHKKQPCTDYPEKVAVLVGDHSAAMSDIKICFSRRWPYAEVTYYPVLVQGKDAPADIINKLKIADNGGYDAIILARGGGSFEDLFCFNDENLVRTIFDLNTYIIAGIGHEQDFSLAEFAADLRAPTPTACVELLTPNISEILDDLANINDHLNYLVTSRIKSSRDSLDKIMYSRVFTDPCSMLNEYYLKIDHYNSVLNSGRKVYEANMLKIDNSILRMKDLIKQKIVLEKKDLSVNLNKLQQSIAEYEKNRKIVLNRNSILLNAYSPLSIMDKGYSIVIQNDRIIKDSKEIVKEDPFTVKFKNGEITAKEL